MRTPDQWAGVTHGEGWEVQLLRDATTRLTSGGRNDLRVALQIAEAVASRSRDSYYVAIALLTRAYVFRLDARPATESDSALHEAEAAIESLDEPKRLLLRPALLGELGIRAKNAGKFTEAESLFIEAVGLSRDPGQLRTHFGNLGDVYLHVGQYDKAERYMERALYVAIKYGDPRGEAETLVQLGILLERKGDRHHAAERLSWAEDLARASDQVKIAHDARINLLMFGLTAPDGSDDADELSELQRELDWYKAAGFGEDVAVLTGQAGVGYARRGQPAQARQLLRAAHADNVAAGRASAAVYDLLNLASVEHQAADYTSSLTAAQGAVREVQRLGLTDLLWPAHQAVARAQLGQLTASDASAVEKLLIRTQHAYEQSMSAVDLRRDGVDRPERRELLAADTESLFDEVIAYAAAIKDFVPNSEMERLAYSACERSKSRILLDLLGADRIARSMRHHPLMARRRAISEALEGLPHDGEQTTQLLNQLQEVREQIARDAPAIAVTSVAEVDEICDHMPDDTALVEYFIAERGRSLSIFVITRAGIVRWDRRDLLNVDLSRMVAQFRTELGAPPHPADRSTRDLGPTRTPDEASDAGSRLGEQLYDLLIGDIPATLGPDIRRLIVVPHRELHLLPFAALHTMVSRERDWLSDRYDLTVLPSGSLLPQCRNMRRPSFQAGGAVVLGNPTGDLPGATREATMVAETLGVPPLLGDDATRASLLHPAARGAVTHVASHGVFDTRDPLLSGIRMADGRVTVDELTELQDPPALLVLSACVTGLALRRLGDELVGLSRGAAVAGTPSVLATLWNVDDESTAHFAQAFYEAVLDGASLDKAVTQAQRQLRHMHTEPWYWAPFVLIGDWRGLIDGAITAHRHAK